jgi:hypothetical protein
MAAKTLTLPSWAQPKYVIPLVLAGGAFFFRNFLSKPAELDIKTAIGHDHEGIRSHAGIYESFSAIYGHIKHSPKLRLSWHKFCKKMDEFMLILDGIENGYLDYEENWSAVSRTRARQTTKPWLAFLKEVKTLEPDVFKWIRNNFYNPHVPGDIGVNTTDMKNPILREVLQNESIDDETKLRATHHWRQPLSMMILQHYDRIVAAEKQADSSTQMPL